MTEIAPNKINAQGLLYQAANQLGFNPLVMDIDGDGIALLAPEHGVQLDINMDGTPENIGWVAPDDGLLVLDRNGNGVIDQLGELFSGTPFGGFYELGLEEAASGNGSGNISADDIPLFSQLRIWRDANSDGISQAGELTTLAQHDIEMLEVPYSQNLQDTRWLQGNYLNLFSGFFGPGEDFIGHITQVDFSLAGITDFITDDGIYTGNDASLLALPQSRGFGSLPSWQDAMGSNPTLRGMIEDFAARTDYSGTDAAVKAILFEWAGVTDFEPGLNDRDPFHPRNIRFMEELLGVDYPWDYAVSDRHVVMHAWELAFNDFKSLLLVQGPLANLFPHAEYDFATDELHLNDTLPDIITRVETSTLAENIDFLFALRNILLFSRDGLNVTESEINQTAAELLAQAWGNPDLIAPLMAAFESGRLITGESETLWDFIGLTYAFEGTIYGEVILGGDGDDKLSGNGGADVIYGGEGDDIIANGVNYELNHLAPSSFYDTLFGGDGDDRFVLSGRELQASGDEGNDTFVAVRSTAAEPDISRSTLEGGAGNDTFIGNSGYVTIMGGDGDDVVQRAETWVNPDSFHTSYINLGNGDDLYEQTGHDNTVYGGTGDDTITSYGSGHFYGGEGNDLLNGSEYDDVLIGDSGNDTLTGYNGDNTYVTGSGNDHIVIFSRTSAVDTVIDFDWHHDSLEFRDTTVSRMQDLDITDVDGDAVITMPTGQTIILENINSNYLIYVNITFSAPNIIDGTSRVDTLIGTDESDLINGFGEPDTLYGGEGYDTLIGGLGRDMLHGGAGADMLYGGFDSAHASYAGDTVGVDVDLGDAGPQSRGDAEGDILDNIRGVIGGDGNDMLVGSTGNNTLVGGAGSDTLDGGDHADLLTGGAGDDIFRFSSFEHSRLPNDSDRITDFEVGVDKIDLSAFDAGPGVPYFLNITTAPATGERELRVEHDSGITYVLSDQLDFGFRLNGDYSDLLTNEDFIF